MRQAGLRCGIRRVDGESREESGGAAAPGSGLAAPLVQGQAFVFLFLSPSKVRSGALRWECLPEASVPHGSPAGGPAGTPRRPLGHQPTWPRCGDCPRARSRSHSLRHAPLAILVLGSKEPQRGCSGGHGQGCVWRVPCDLSRPRRTLGHPLLSPVLRGGLALSLGTPWP